LNDQPRIAYLMSRFPHLPETFILREVVELKRDGWNVSIYPLINEKEAIQHEEARELNSEIEAIPFISLNIIKKNIKVIASKPLIYATTLIKTIFGNISSPKFLIRALVIFPKVIYLAEIMAEEGIDHIHAHFATHPGLAAWIIHQIEGIPYSITIHAHDLYVERPMLKRKINDAEFIVTISNFNKELICHFAGNSTTEKVHVIHCGIRFEDYSSIKGDGNQKHPFKIISIGSLQPYKGHRVLIDACKILKEKGLQFTCEIIGGGSLEKQLNRQVDDLGLIPFVHFLGPLPQEAVSQILPTANCYVQPSIIDSRGKMEGIPVAIMEAMACKVPVVASNISGIPELVIDGVTGLLVEPGDPFLLAGAIERIYDGTINILQMVDSGMKMVQNEYSVNKNTRQLEALFENVNLMKGKSSIDTHLKEIIQSKSN